MNKHVKNTFTIFIAIGQELFLCPKKWPHGAPMAPWCAQALAECGELQCRDHGLWSRWGSSTFRHDACDLTWVLPWIFFGIVTMGISWGYSKLWLGDRDTTAWYNLLKWGYLFIWEYNRLTMLRGENQGYKTNPCLGMWWGNSGNIILWWPNFSTVDWLRIRDLTSKYVFFF